MTMCHIMVGFEGHNGRLDGSLVTARGLHGCLYTVLKEHNANEAGWLHAHSSPKPYSMAPYYRDDGQLMGLRMAAIGERAAALLVMGWRQAQQSGQLLHLGPQALTVRAVEWMPGPGFAQFAGSPAGREVGLRFLSPTTFRQGPGELPLPLPGNVFSWPLRVWQAYAPPVLTVPGDWLDWCKRDVFVTGHRIETAVISLSKTVNLTGFVGEVNFRARAGHTDYLYIWQAISDLAAFCGIGYKTTMGMGAVERI